MISAILSEIRKANPKKILDLGSGNGAITAAIHNAGYNIVGMEPDHQGHSISTQKYPEIPFYHLSCYDSPDKLPESGFDFVLSSEVVEHLYYPGKLLNFAYQVLPPGGKLLITCPYHGYLKNLIISLVDGWDKQHTSLYDGKHVKFWSFATLRALFERHHFKVLWQGGCGRLPYLWNCALCLGSKF